MKLASVVQITTPKKFALFGLWYGPQKPRRVIIVVHGLCSSVFSRINREIPQQLADSKTAVLTFNNRGHDIVSSVYSVNPYGKTLKAGGAHEIFTDCVDDIRGAVLFVKKKGVREIYLAGHSTGCQKAVYYAYKIQKQSHVTGIILLAPVSDYAAAQKTDKKGRLARAVGKARKLVQSGKKHELLSASLLTQWSVNDAQRFLSLYTPDSVETIFPYEQTGKVPRLLRSIKKPILVLWAEKDQYNDRPAKKIRDWFVEHLKKGDQVVIIPGVHHGFRGQEKRVARTIHSWISNL
ncbi:MAG: alpha/beta fold hydrolase [bacterium]|nr:alpha/beta fold hydrolase [bacterium]